MTPFSFSDEEIRPAVQYGYLELMKILLKSRVNKNPIVYTAKDGSRFTLLHDAAYNGQLGIIKWFKDELKFSNINPEDKKGNTPFSCAILEDKQDVVDYFIELGYGNNASSKIM